MMRTPWRAQVVSMDSSEDKTDKPAELSRPGRLELKKTVASGQVKQSFSHGRSKTVTVEVKRKRTFARGASGGMKEVRAPLELPPEVEMPAVKADTPAPEEVVKAKPIRTLTEEERAARARALESAQRDAEQAAAERALAPPPPVDEEPVVEQAPEPVVPKTAAERRDDEAAERRRIEEAARSATESATKRHADEAATRAAAEAERRRLLAVPEPGSEAAAPRRGGPPAPAAAGASKTDRAAARPNNRSRGDERRRGGKLTISQALSDDGGERMRSVAAFRRRQQRERAKAMSGGGAQSKRVIREVVIPDSITVGELANRMAERGAEVIKALMKMEIMATINHPLDQDTAELVVEEFGHKVRKVSASDVEIGVGGEVDEEVNLQPRPPIVTVMGHVDHGKTSLLDALRKTDVVAGEAGGITQHIGAYQVKVASGAVITFLDTPGHAAFTAMRQRGAQVTDIVILVVAADDGVQPQTVEALNHARAAGVPVIVAINKCDRAEADPTRIKNELLSHEIVVEDLGGDTQAVEISATEGTNLDALLEALALQAEIQELSANPDREAYGAVVEARLERGRGAVATVLVQRGTLRVGDIFVAGGEWGRVRALIDDHGKNVKQAAPSTPVEVLGANGVPLAGDEFAVVDNESRAREITDYRRQVVKTKSAAASARGSLEQMFDRISAGEQAEVPLVIKADVQGSVEAIVGALAALETDEVKARILHAGVGGITESDVSLAQASGGIVIGFNVRANPQARELAKRDDVQIRYYSVIYDAVDEVKDLLSGKLAPKVQETHLGSAEVREVFAVSKVGKVAGCMITDGIVRRGAKVRLMRDDVIVHEGSLSTLKRFKDDAREVREGYECGLALENYNDVHAGDVIECYTVEEIARAL